MPKLNRYERTELKHLVTNAIIRRLSTIETQQLVKERLQLQNDNEILGVYGCCGRPFHNTWNMHTNFQPVILQLYKGKLLSLSYLGTGEGITTSVTYRTS